MSKSTTFLESIKGKDAAWLRTEVHKRAELIRTLKFDLDFGKVDALVARRVAKRERAQLLTTLTQSIKAGEK